MEAEKTTARSTLQLLWTRLSTTRIEPIRQRYSFSTTTTVRLTPTEMQAYAYVSAHRGRAAPFEGYRPGTGWKEIIDFVLKLTPTRALQPLAAMPWMMTDKKPPSDVETPSALL